MTSDARLSIAQSRALPLTVSAKDLGAPSVTIPTRASGLSNPSSLRVAHLFVEINSLCAVQYNDSVSIDHSIAARRSAFTASSSVAIVIFQMSLSRRDFDGNDLWPLGVLTLMSRRWARFRCEVRPLAFSMGLFSMGLFSMGLGERA
jgi:hypothetical protein